VRMALSAPPSVLFTGIGWLFERSEPEP